MIKVVISAENNFGLQQDSIASESVWAVPIDERRAFIMNIPFHASDVCIDDVVETSGEGDVRQFVKIISGSRYTIMVAYASELTDRDEAMRRVNILKQLEAFDGDKSSINPTFKLEGMKMGLCVVAVQSYFSPHKAKLAIKKIAKDNGFNIDLEMRN